MPDFKKLNLYTAKAANSMGIVPKESHIKAHSLHVKGSIASGLITWLGPKRASNTRARTIATPAA